MPPEVVERAVRMFKRSCASFVIHRRPVNFVVTFLKSYEERHPVPVHNKVASGVLAESLAKVA